MTRSRRSACEEPIAVLGRSVKRASVEQSRIQLLEVADGSRDQSLPMVRILRSHACLLDIEQGPRELSAHTLQVADAAG